MSRNRQVWVVEGRWYPRGKAWQACSSGYLSKKDAIRAILYNWSKNVGVEYRVTKYIPAEPEK